MWHYDPPLADFEFVMDMLLDVRADWAEMPAFAELDADLAPQILDAAGKFVVETLGPINASGDLEGCRYADGAVRTPAGYAAAYRRYCEAGWPALACDPAFGGQGLPQIVNAALYEMLFATNHGWTMYPGIVHGAYECLRTHATPEIVAAYLPKIVSGEWLCTMCLTEAQAGSDVGLVRARAEPDPDGSHRVTGSKIFISGGDQDLTANIVHLVLARIPDAPPGTRGISLFLVPKLLPDGRANFVRCIGIEHKMGLKGSATCAMAFDGAQGWLVGEPQRGLAAMFVMMNSARLYVGLQGLGHAEMALQNAARHASQRVQMRVPMRPAHPGGAHPIIDQPAIRKTLMTLRAFVEGARALGLWSAHLLDIAEHHPDVDRRAAANDLLSLLTPIIKSFFTERGFAATSDALQVWGGYGYLHDYGIEQSLRDSRAAMIYEGTNEIQAADLLVRKIIGDGGRRFPALVAMLEDEAARCREVPLCASYGIALEALAGSWRLVTEALIAEAAAHPGVADGIAADYLRLAGLCLLATVWGRTARAAAPNSEQPFQRRKLETARFYYDYLLPEAQLRLALVERRHAAVPVLDAAP
jgi:alkylation response protein AidB-like acyl-CoA dehydrogenase